MTSSLLLQRADLDRLDESLQAVETQHEAALEAAASPEHVRVKELPNHMLMLKPNDDPEVTAFHDHHVNGIRQQHQGQTGSSLQQQDQLTSSQQQPQEQQPQQPVRRALPIRTRVFVHVSNGSKLSMLVDIVVVTVGNVKLRVDSCTGMKPSYQRVILAGRELTDDSQTLYSLGMYVEVVIVGLISD